MPARRVELLIKKFQKHYGIKNIFYTEASLEILIELCVRVSRIHIKLIKVQRLELRAHMVRAPCPCHACNFSSGSCEDAQP